MRLSTLCQAWNAFFFKPQSPVPIAVFRTLYGLCVLATVLLLRPDWLAWFGTHSIATLRTMSSMEPDWRIDLFAILPQNDLWIEAFFWVFLAFALMLTMGLLTRLSSVAVFLCLSTIHERNLFIVHSGDVFLRVAGFFLMFAPAGAALSLDRLIRIRLGKEGTEIEFKSPWAQRMIQFQLAMVYLVGFWWKSLGVPWVSGTALYYVIHLEQIRRFPLPSFLTYPLVLKLGSWLTLIFEGAFGVLIWIREFRYPLLAAGLVFHLCLEYALNVPMFQWDVLSAYVLFIDPRDLTRLRKWFAVRCAEFAALYKRRFRTRSTPLRAL